MFAAEHKSAHGGFEAVQQLLAQVARLSESHSDKLVTGGILYNGSDPDYRGPVSYFDSNLLLRSLSDRQCAFLRPHLLEFKPFFVNLYDAQVQRFETLTPESRATLVALAAAWERRTPQQMALLRQVADRLKRVSQTWASRDTC